jgi:ABC-type Mn2+/Zn2+ transport system ATPase subunit
MTRNTSPVESSLVRAIGVSVRFGRTPVLEDVDLDIRPAEFVGLVGPSGAGKTTLLRTILGLVQPGAGRVEREPSLRIGYVPQVGSVDWSFPLTVSECVLLSRARQRNLPWATRDEKARVADLLERLGLADLGDRHLRDLSGGQQQRVFVARALVSDPHLLVLDEPTSGVDVRTRHEVLHLLADLHSMGPAIVLATHDLNGLAAHLPHIVCLNRRIVASGVPLDVLTPEVLEATYGAPFEVLVHAGFPVVIDHGLGVLGHRHQLEPVGVVS